MNVTLAFKHTPGKNSTFWDKLQVKAIKWWTKSEYYHVEMIIKDEWISATPEEGITIRSLQPLRSNYDYAVVDIDGRKISKALKFIESQKDAEYDWDGIFLSQFMDVDLHDSNKWFCSELVTEVLTILGEDLDESNKYSPGDLAKIYLK